MSHSQTSATPQRRWYKRGKIIIPLIVALIGAASVIIAAIITRSTVQVTQLLNACPSADTVAQLMILSPDGDIRKINNEPCAFVWGSNGVSTNQAHCPEG